MTYSYIFVFLILLFIIGIRHYVIKKRKRKLSDSLKANCFIQELTKVIDENKYNLLEERTRLIIIDPYGNEDLKKWIGTPPLNQKEIYENIKNDSKFFKEGIPYFWGKVILRHFDGPELFFDKWKSYCSINPFINDEIIGERRELKTEDWFVFVASQIEKSCLNLIENSYEKKNKNYIKGINFEVYCMEILKKNGWEVKQTPITGDQGVDIIASINGFRK